MTRGIRILVVSMCLAGAVGSPSQARAQGDTPLGSTTIAGPPDSAFAQFVAFLKVHGDSATAVNPGKHTVQAKVEGADELMIFTFESYRDSTTIGARGKKGGMAALIIGLGVLDDWLTSRTSSRPDGSEN